MNSKIVKSVDDVIAALQGRRSELLLSNRELGALAKIHHTALTKAPVKGIGLKSVLALAEAMGVEIVFRRDKTFRRPSNNMLRLSLNR